MKTRAITLLTDFGSADYYVAAMKGVILGIHPEAQLVDISHEIRPFAIPQAAFVLSQAWQHFPKGTVHLIVVDPGVGSARRPILAEAGGQRFVAPDNGVLTLVFDAIADHKVREITASRFFRQPVSQTFHGRDIFGPVAAHLAAGLPPARFGKRIDDYVRLPFSTGTVLHIDRFGNVVTTFRADDLRSPFSLRIGERRISRLATSYADVEPGRLFVIAGSAGFLEVSINQGSAAEALRVSAGAPVELERLR
jgi:S-adenosyl-L-methionine hydrolase (adenosine-forming)